jgi:hypothetical protein
MSGVSVLQHFEAYQKARVAFVQAVAEAATRPQNIEVMQNAGVMQLLRPLLLDNVRRLLPVLGESWAVVTMVPDRSWLRDARCPASSSRLRLPWAAWPTIATIWRRRLSATRSCRSSSTPSRSRT